MKSIGPFKEFKGQPSTLKYGYYFDSIFKLPFARDKRHVRVWLPEDYDFSDPNKRFPVIYFSDGQNLVDRYLTAYGEWKLDKTAHRLLRRGMSFIAVGIDCPKIPLERMNELNPPYPVDAVPKDEGPDKPIGDKYVDYIADKLKPLIDSLFNTIPDKEHTAVGGSSMGGIMAFYAYIRRPEVFGYSLSFSPAFFLYKEKTWRGILKQYEMPIENKVCLYVGGAEYETIFVDPTLHTYEYLKKAGADENHLLLIVDGSQRHNEKAWSIYLETALEFWLKDLRGE